MKLNDLVRQEQEQERKRLLVPIVMDLRRRVAAVLNRLASVLAAVGRHAIKSRAGTLGAEKRWGDRSEYRAIIERLARRKDMQQKPEIPSVLWFELFAALDEAGRHPDERDGGRSYEYEGDNAIITITQGAFSQALHRARRARQ